MNDEVAKAMFKRFGNASMKIACGLISVLSAKIE